MRFGCAGALQNHAAGCPKDWMHASPRGRAGFRRDPRKPHTIKNHRRKIHRWFCFMSMGAELLPEAVSKHPEPWHASRLGNVTQYTCDTVLSASPVRGSLFCFAGALNRPCAAAARTLRCMGAAFEQRAQQVAAGGCGLYLAPLAAATKAYRLALSWRAAGVGASRSNPQYSSVALPRRTTARGEARVLS